MSKSKKGASVLQLNNQELRRELIYADDIIQHSLSVMTELDKLVVVTMVNQHTVGTPSDGFRFKSRERAMHRITPKYDVIKIMLLVMALVFGAAWAVLLLENQVLRSDLMQQKTQEALYEYGQ